MKFILGWIWALPTSLLGLVLVGLSGASPYRIRPRGSWWWVARHGPWKWYFDLTDKDATTIGAITVCAESCKDDPETIRHERQHFYQTMVLGFLFVPAFFGLCLWEIYHGRDPYAANPLEVQAYAVQHEVDS